MGLLCVFPAGQCAPNYIANLNSVCLAGFSFTGGHKVWEISVQFFFFFNGRVPLFVKAWDSGTFSHGSSG